MGVWTCDEPKSSETIDWALAHNSTVISGTKTEFKNLFVNPQSGFPGGPTYMCGTESNMTPGHSAPGNYVGGRRRQSSYRGWRANSCSAGASVDSSRGADDLAAFLDFTSSQAPMSFTLPTFLSRRRDPPHAGPIRSNLPRHTRVLCESEHRQQFGRGRGIWIEEFIVASCGEFDEY